MQNSRILSLYEDAGGILWIGTDGGGLYSYTNGEWSCFGFESGLMSNHVTAVTEDSKGNLWIGTEYGLYRFGGEEVRVFGLDEGLADNLVTALAADDAGRVWAGTMRGGLARFEEGLVQIYGARDGLTEPTVLSLAAGADGRVWIGTMHGLFCLDPEEGVVVPIGQTLDYPVTSIAAMPGGRVLIGTMTEGLKLFDGAVGGDLQITSDAAVEDLITEDELADSHICSIIADREGFVWAGTESRGLVQLKERRVGAIAGQEVLPPGPVYPILEDDDGALWVGSEKNGLIFLRDNRVQGVINRDRDLAGDMVRSLMMDNLGALWVGTMDGGLSVLTGTRIRLIIPFYGFPSDNVTAILAGGDGVVWIGTDNGLSKCKDEKIRDAEVTLEGQTIRTLYEGADGALYAGTRSGVWMMTDQSFERIVASNDTTTYDALSLCEDSEGALWAGTNGGGLKRISNNEIKTYTTEDGLPGNFIFSIIEEANLLWMSCENGVFSVSRDSLNAYADGSVVMLAPTLYDDVDGMPSARCSGFCQPAVCVSAYGKRYYPTDGGIAVFDMDFEPALSRPPVARIEEILADDVPVYNDGSGEANRIMSPIELPSGIDRMEILFTAFDYSAPEKLRFLYKLNGYDSDFTALHPGQDRRAIYQDLPPGEYRFRIRAISNDGLWSEGAATVSFAIAPPFHRTKAFLFLVIAVIALAAGAAAFVSRYRRIKRERMKYSTTSISDERMENALAELQALIEEEKIYLDPDLTLQKLAKRLKIHYNHLSRIINERFGVSFKNYINAYRVEEAKRLLADPAERNRNIIDIMYDAGFYSKSTFNTAFRKFAGTSPSNYRKKHL
jgi:ligand-binding sensor domain-containing protein/AraC-like DNA-binding protein